MWGSILLLASATSGCYQGVIAELIPDPDAPPLSEDADADDEGTDADGPSCELDQVRTIFDDYGCTSCHDTTPGSEGGGLDLISEGLAERLVNQPSRNSTCSGELLVHGQEPMSSLLLRVLDPERYAGFGSDTCQPPLMPPAGNPVSEDDMDCLEGWVTWLADQNGGPEPAPFDPAPLETAVSKVKYLLNGGAVTDEELDFARDEETGELDPEALRTLIDGWMWAEPGVLTAEFDTKLQMFLDLSLQQRNINKSDTFKYGSQLNLKTDDAPPAINRSLFARTLAPMFVLTARDIVADRHDFREVITTRRWRVSTAILAALVHADTDLLNHKNRFDEEDKFGAFAHLQESDYTDWRHVNITQATSDSPPDFEYENTAELAAALRGIGDESTIRILAPRVGFFNTFAFFDQWRSNEDNDFRITISQSLIAALDLIFEVGDSTTPASLEGLDEEHANEGDACHGCHKSIDPMRTIFSSYYGYRNRPKQQQDEISSTFAFHGQVVDPIDTMDELASALASHPRLAAGWTQKLCMWSNSQRCHEDNPDFQRVAETFRSGYDTDSPNDDFRFDILVREFFSSTLVTGATEILGHDRVEFTVSTTRFRHFCQATNARLHQAAQMRCEEEQNADINQCAASEENCLGQWKIAEALGRDSYIRGAREFSTPNTEDPMYSIATRQACRDVAKGVAGDNQPFPRSGDPSANIERMVKTIMGLPESHPRHEAAYESLLRTYQILRTSDPCPAGETFVTANEGISVNGEFVCGAGLNGSEANQHVFVIACESPDLSGIGF